MGEVITNSQIGGRRNMVINGAMQVAQRATTSGTGGVGSANGVYVTLDRYEIFAGSTAGRATMTQTSDGPSGFANCLKLECTTADTSIAADENFGFTQKLEGQDLQQIKKGTSDAEKITLSFYVKGNASATYQVELKDQDNTRVNSQTFAVTTSWNRVILTFNADTTGAFDDDNAASLTIFFWLHAGATYNGGTFTSNTWASQTNANRIDSNNTSFFDSTDRTFFITGLQMEVGSQATPFEHRSFGEELNLAYRYYYRWDANDDYGNLTMGVTQSATTCRGTYNLPNTMRASPAMTSNGTFRVYDVSASRTVSGITFVRSSDHHLFIQFAGSSYTTNRMSEMGANNDSDAYIEFNAEL